MGRTKQQSPNPGPTSTTVRAALLDIDAVAVALGTSKRHVQRLVAERRIPFVKVGRFVRFEPAAVDAWIDAQRIAPVPRRSRYETTRRQGAFRRPGGLGSYTASTPPAFAFQMVDLDPRW
jgi:excisionase family DNA binding protein